MLTDERKKHLLDVCSAQGRIVAKEEAERLGVSDDTIRRDLRQLAKEGLLQRVHGGALPASAAVGDMRARATISSAEKSAIGAAAADMVQKGQVVFLDGGTTTLEIVRHLDQRLRATVVTHSPTIASALIDHDVDVRIIGGHLFKHSMVTVGAETIESICQIRADTYYMGVTGIHAEIGLSTGDAEEAKIKRALAEASADVVVLASPEKIGAASPFIIGSATLMTTMIAPAGVNDAQLTPFREIGVDIVMASTDGPGQHG